MEYRVVVATFLTSIGQRIRDGRALPFQGQSSVSLQEASLTELRLTSDHPRLRDLRRIETDGQRLLDDAGFGCGPTARTLPAGAPLTLDHATLLRDDEGEEFFALFPTTLRDGVPVRLGDGHSVLLIPRPRDLAEGGTHWPSLRCHALYTEAGVFDMDSDREGIALDPQQGGTACFCHGTQILTPEGPRPVETLRVGGLVRTRDHGAQRIRWTSPVELGPQGLAQQPHLHPIRIAAGALGDATPAEDLLVSPRQRVVVRSSVARSLFGLEEVLVSARHLLGLPGITQDHRAQGWAMCICCWTAMSWCWQTAPGPRLSIQRSRPWPRCRRPNAAKCWRCSRNCMAIRFGGSCAAFRPMRWRPSIATAPGCCSRGVNGP